MDYPISFNNGGVYSVPDTRFTRYGFSLQRPTALLKPSCPITSTNMLPYQVANSGVPYGYTLVPNNMLGPGQRLLPVPGGRNVYSYVDPEDDWEDYTPPPPRPRSRVLDDSENPEMEEFSATTRQIRRDADSILQRLGTSRPTSTRASTFWRTYDYDTRPLGPKYLAPPVDRSSLRPTSPTLDEETDPHLQSLRPGRSNRYIHGGSRLSTVGAERLFTPTNLTANRVQTLYKDLDESLYAPEIRAFDYTACLRRDRQAAGEKVRGDVQTRAVLLEPSSGLADARERRTTVKRERLGYDPNSVRSNISIRAQYAGMRAAAGRSTIRLPLSAEPAMLSTTRAAPPPPPAPPAPKSETPKAPETPAEAPSTEST